MPVGYENRRVGHDWGGFHRSLALSLTLFNRRWVVLTGPYNFTRSDGSWSGDVSAKDCRANVKRLMVQNPEVGFRVRVRGTPPTQDQYVLRRFLRSLGADVIRFALSQLGVPYVWADEDPKGGGSSGFDCSGLFKWCYAQVGYDLPHNAEAIRQVMTPCSIAAARPGDALFYGEGGVDHGPAGHIAVKLDDTRIIDTASVEHPVSVRGINDVWIGKPPFAAGYIAAVTGPH